MRVALIITALITALMAAACTSGGMAGDPGGGGDNLVIKVESNNTGTLRVDLQGPVDPTLLTVQYFIYGTNEDHGDDNPAPLAHLRMDEASFGPLAYGEELLDVDLSPWAQYPFIYVRHLGVLPNITHRLTPGRHYLFNAYFSQ